MSDVRIQPSHQYTRILFADPGFDTPPWHLGMSGLPLGTPALPQPVYDLGMAYSSQVNDFQQRVYNVMDDLSRRLDHIIHAISPEREPDYDYLDRACATAASAPEVTMTQEEALAYVGLGSFTYSIDNDY